MGMKLHGTYYLTLTECFHFRMMWAKPYMKPFNTSRTKIKHYKHAWNDSLKLLRGKVDGNHSNNFILYTIILDFEESRFCNTHTQKEKEN